MNKRLIKLFVFVTALALSVMLLASCDRDKPRDKTEPLSYDESVVSAFNTVKPEGAIVSQTAAKDGSGYSVTVIDAKSVKVYKIGADFSVNDTVLIVESNAAENTAALVVSEAKSDFNRAFEKALLLASLTREEVRDFDFDREVYKGEKVFKVELEDAVAEYEYILRASDLELLDSKVEYRNSKTGNSTLLGEQKAKAIAFEVAGITASQARDPVVRTKLNDGTRVYEINFDYSGYRYEVELDAVKGDIIEFSKCILDENAARPNIDGNITEQQAKDIAIAFAFPDGLGDKKVEFRKVKLDYEDDYGEKMFVYEIEFVVGTNEYELEISASDGTILDAEIEEDDGDDDDDRVPSDEKFITSEQAAQNVLDIAGKGAVVSEVEIDVETIRGERRYYYEVEVRIGNREVDYYVDAVTGEVFEDLS